VNTAFKPAGAGSSAKERKTTDETADATADVPPSSKKKRPAKQAVGDEKEAAGGAKSGKGSKKAAPEKEDEPAERMPASKVRHRVRMLSIFRSASCLTHSPSLRQKKKKAA
jgi:hypothetical protein